MQKILLFLFVIISLQLNAQQLFPYGIDVLAGDNNIPVELQNQNLFNVIYTAPAAQNIRTAGQFEEMSGVTITWTSFNHIQS